MKAASITVQPDFNSDALAAQIYSQLASSLSQPYNFFVGITLRKVLVTKHANKTQICDETCLLKIDLDNITKERLPGIITKMPVPPSFVVWSGHGAHLYFALSGPISSSTAETIDKYLSTLDKSADSGISDRTRLLRLAGSLNWKDPNNPLPVEVLDEYSSGGAYEPSVFTSLVDELESATQGMSEASSEQEAIIAQAIATSPEFLQLEAEVSKLSERMQSIVFQAIDTKRPENHDRSSLLQSAVTGMVAADWTNELIAQVLTCDSFSISGRLQEESKKGRGAAEYLAQSISKARDYVAKNSNKFTKNSRNATTIAPAQTGSLTAQIAQILKETRRTEEDYHTPCAQLVINALGEFGEFIYASDSLDTHDAVAPKDKCFYRDTQNRIIAVANEEFDTLLMLQFGLPGLQGLHKSIRNFVINQIAANYRQYRSVEFANISRYQNNTFYVTQGCGQVCKISADSIDTIANGDDGVFFHDELRSWQYDANHSGCFLDDVFQLSVDPNAPYSEAQAILAVKTWFIANFMRGQDMVNHYAILNMIGEKGSGKSTIIENMIRVMTGDSSYTASGRPREERDFSTAVRNRGIVVFDNVEGYNYKWGFEDALARVYQHGTYTERKLFTNNTRIQFKTNTFISLTAIRPGWGRSDVADRSIVLELANWAKQKSTSHQTQQQHLAHLIAHRNQIMSEVVDSLQKLLQHLQSHSLDEYRINHRLESYAMVVNAWCVANEITTHEKMDEFWTALQEAQEDLVNVDPVTVELIIHFINDVIRNRNSLSKDMFVELKNSKTLQVGVKLFRVYDYLKNQSTLTNSEYSSYNHFNHKVSEHQNALAKKGILMADKRDDNNGRYWLIDYSEYLFQNSSKLDITSKIKNKAIETTKPEEKQKETGTELVEQA
jgi:energy-coupling factor transporter ATP-binding protein EcfA2